MKLVAKKGVFLSSAQKTNGTTGEFSIQMPYDYSFDPNQVFKIWLSQINMRNTFPWITNANRRFYIQVTRAGDTITDTLDCPRPNAYADWTAIDIPLGCPTCYEVCRFINQKLYNMTSTDYNDPLTTLYCAYRYGKLFFYVSGSQDYDVHLWFMPTITYDGRPQTDTYGAAFLTLGFPRANEDTFTGVRYYLLTAHKGPNNARMDGNAGAASVPWIVPDDSVSPQLMDADHLNNIVIKTDLPSENYVVSSDGPVQNGVTCNIPVDVPPGGQLLYEDIVGVNAIIEKGRSVINRLMITVQNKFGVTLRPDHDWSFVLNIETYEDVDAEQLKLLQGAAQSDDQMIQLMKMQLLQKELKQLKH